MSSDRLPEFFFDRSLGKTSARLLRDHGWIVHLIADFYPKDASDVPDERWIAEGCRRGWILLTKDKKIRYRTQQADREQRDHAEELAALDEGHLFSLASGNLGLEEMAERFLDAGPAIVRGSRKHDVGFWHVHAGGRISKMWP